ncbi:MAG TPA: phenylalanine--tRNA ligase subunit beta [Pyrinomonadaceae bacterium]|nr:phenylalanine--tRNA ligase subunit beta [Pyrinomonadaceae bacterium]
MNISYNWLKDLVETDLTPQEIAKNLTKVGLAVEGIHPHENDFVFDIDLTSNRGDCLSHLGVARELSAITNSELRVTNYELPDLTNSQLVTIQDTDLCHRFTARIIKNVKIGPSPKWLVQRLEAIGQRSINNVADITNYVMHELGNPMHAFDFNKLAEKRIVVRRAKEGEKMQTLDEVERTFSEDMLLICDAEKPIAVGGVMGGLHSSISEETTEVLLEVAYFKRESIRQTSRKLKLNTEASHHFERGVDIENLIRASNRATELIIEFAGGEAGDFVDLYPTKQSEINVELRYEKIKTLTGLEVSENDTNRILDKLGFQSKTQNPKSKIYTVPTWRHDITIEQDLVEEVARHVGYDKIADELPPSVGAGEYQPNEVRKFHLRQALANLGFDEAISYSFIDTKNDDTFELIPNLIDEKTDVKFITLQDSIIEGAVRMRPTLLSGLLDAVRTNLNYQTKNIKLFELGKVFANSSNEGGLPKEQELFGLVLTGGEVFEGKSMVTRELDFYDAKGALEMAMNAINLPHLDYKAKDIKHLRKGQSAEISFKGKTVGTIGRVNDEISAGYKFKQPIFVAEIDLQTLLAEKENAVFYKPLPKFPAITRDVSLLVKRSTNFSEIIQTIKDQGFELCKNVSFVDVYEGKGMADDERSITIRLEYRSEERTLVEVEIEEVHAKILAEIEKQLGAKQRF